MKWEKLIEQKHLYIGGEIKEVGSPFKHINLIVDINVRPAIDKVPMFIITTEDWLAGGEIKEAKLIKNKNCVKIIKMFFFITTMTVQVIANLILN